MSSAPVPAPASAPLTSLPAAHRRLVTGAVLLGTFIASLEVMVVSPAMPSVVGDLGGAGLYPWVFTAYMAVETVTMPAYGRLSDRWGRRDTYLVGLGLFAFGTLLCGAAGSMEALLLGRAAQGLGAGALVPLPITIFGDLYPIEQRTRMQGLFSLVWGLSSLVGPATGGWVTASLGWRWIFWLNLPFCLLTGALVALYLPRRGPSVAASGESGESGGPGALRRLYQSPVQQTIALAGIALGAGLFGVIGYLPLWIQAVQGGSPMDAGLAVIPLSVAWTLASNVAGRLVRRTGFGPIVWAGTLIVALGASLAAFDTASRLGLILFGLGMGATIASFTVSAQEYAPPDLRGLATSLGLFFRTVGASIAGPAFGWLAGIRPGAADFSGVPNLEAGLRQVFIGVAVAAIIAAMITWLRFPLRPRGAHAR